MTWTRVLRIVSLLSLGIVSAISFSSCAANKKAKGAPPEGYSFMEGDNPFFSDQSVDAELRKIDGLPTPGSYPVAEQSRPSEIIVGRSGNPVSGSYIAKNPAAAPASPQAVVENTPAAVTEHRVAAGETLWGISQKYHTTVDALMAANGLSSPDLKVNQVLQMTAASQQASQGTSTQARTGSTVRSHVVAPGDTLYALSVKYGTTVDYLMAVNQMSDHQLSLGKTLQIP